MPDYKDLFPKSFKAKDFRDEPQVLTIVSAEPRVLEAKDGTVSSKLCIKFEETNRFWFAGKKEACGSVADTIGSTNTDDWIGQRIELFEDETYFGDDLVDCVRARKPSDDVPARKKTAKKASRRSKKNDTYPKHVGDDDAGNALVQTEDGGQIYEIHPDDLKDALSGELTLG